MDKEELIKRLMEGVVRKRSARQNQNWGTDKSSSTSKETPSLTMLQTMSAVTGTLGLPKVTTSGPMRTQAVTHQKKTIPGVLMTLPAMTPGKTTRQARISHTRIGIAALAKMMIGARTSQARMTTSGVRLIRRAKTRGTSRATTQGGRTRKARILRVVTTVGVLILQKALIHGVETTPTRVNRKAEVTGAQARIEAMTPGPTAEKLRMLHRVAIMGHPASPEVIAPGVMAKINSTCLRVVVSVIQAPIGATTNGITAGEDRVRLRATVSGNQIPQGLAAARGMQTSPASNPHRATTTGVEAAGTTTIRAEADGTTGIRREADGTTATKAEIGARSGEAMVPTQLPRGASAGSSPTLSIPAPAAVVHDPGSKASCRGTSPSQPIGTPRTMTRIGMMTLKMVPTRAPSARNIVGTAAETQTGAEMTTETPRTRAETRSRRIRSGDQPWSPQCTIELELGSPRP